MPMYENNEKKIIKENYFVKSMYHGKCQNDILLFVIDVSKISIQN